MNEQIMRAVGFSKEVDLVNAGKCPICEVPVEVRSFKDNVSAREFAISGLCQKCQDDIFKEKDDELPDPNDCAEGSESDPNQTDEDYEEEPGGCS